MILDTYNYRSKRMFYQRPKFFVSQNGVNFQEIIADSYGAAHEFFTRLHKLKSTTSLFVKVIYVY